MVALLVSNISICAFASDLNDGVNDGFDRYMGGSNIKGFNSWEITDKKSLFANNIATFFADIGMYFRGQSNQSLLNIFTEHLIETNRIENADSLDSYIASHLTANEEETELYMSSDMVNSLHETAVTYIEEETGYFVIPTIDAYTYYKQRSNLFNNKTMYDAFLNVLDNLGDNEILCIYDEFLYTTSTYIHYTVWTEDCDFLLQYNPYTISGYGISLKGYDDNWEIADIYKTFTLDSQGIISENETMRSSFPFTYGMENHGVSRGIEEPPNIYHMFDYNGNTFQTRFMLTKGSRYIRAYKTLDDLKTYSLGTRPYYITDAFKNYDSTVDNSTTITQTEIDNSVTYGDVYNYITNNYENPDGLTEDELRAILAEYLSSINNSGGSGSGSGSGDSGGSGGGLGGFLDGLGSIGNAILAILGKLMEILGSAIELVTGAITDLITIIPNSIGELLGALFPVFPEEWIKAITLSLVLGVIVGIMRMFK